MRTSEALRTRTSMERMRTAGKVVSRLLNVAVTAGKRVRSETGISKGAVSISSATAEFTQYVIKETSNGHIDDIADSKITGYWCR